MAWLCRKYRFTTSEDRFIPGSGMKLMPEEIQKLARQLKGTGRTARPRRLHRQGIPHPALPRRTLPQWREGPVAAHRGFFSATSRPSTSRLLPSVRPAIDITLLHETCLFPPAPRPAHKAQTGILPRPSVMRPSRSSSCANPRPLRARFPRHAFQERAGRPIQRHPGFDPGLEADVEMAWLRPYAAARTCPRVGFHDRHQRICQSPHQLPPRWLGDVPLRNLKPGRHTIHGIPFQVSGGNNRKDCGVIVLQSLVNSEGKARKAPHQGEVPHRPARSRHLHPARLRLLKVPQPLCRLLVYNGKKKLGEVPIISLGKPPPEITPSEMKQALQTANIQDWWPDYPHFDFPHSRFAPIAGGRLGRRDPPPCLSLHARVDQPVAGWRDHPYRGDGRRGAVHHARHPGRFGAQALKAWAGVSDRRRGLVGDG